MNELRGKYIGQRLKLDLYINIYKFNFYPTKTINGMKMFETDWK